MSCGRKIGQFDCCSVVQGDCLELMKRLYSRLICQCGADVTGEGGLFHVIGGHENRELKVFDVCITDPPYGIGRDGQQETTGGHGGRKGYEFKGWDAARPNGAVFDEIMRLSSEAVIWGGNYFADLLPATGKWLVWDKGQRINQSDGELAWTNRDGALRIYTANRVELLMDGAEHPTQKPLRLMLWCVNQFPEANTIFDPFAGSGTTLVAAAKLGKHFLGFEIDAEYCAIARARIAAVEAQPTLFQSPAEQLLLETVR